VGNEQDTVKDLDDILDGFGSDDDVRMASAEETQSHDIEVEGTSLKFESEILLKRLGPLNDVIRRDAIDIVNKSVFLSHEADKVCFRAKPGESFVQIIVPISGEVTEKTEDFFLEFKPLFALMKESEKTFVFVDEAGVPVIRLYKGSVRFENYRLDPKRFEHPSFSSGLSEENGYTKVEGASFFKFLQTAYKSMELSTRTEDRKINVIDGVSYSGFLSSAVVIKNIPLDLSLRSEDVYFLMRFLQGVEEFFFRETDTEYLFATEWSRVVLPRVKQTDLSKLIESLDRTLKKEKIVLYPPNLHQVVKTSLFLLGAESLVNLINDAGRLSLQGKNYSGRFVNFLLSEESDFHNKFSVVCLLPILKTVSEMLLAKKLALEKTSGDDETPEEKLLLFIGEKGQMLFQFDDTKVYLAGKIK